MIDATGKLFGKLNIIDAVALLVALVVALGIILVQSGLYQTSGQVIEKEGDIVYTVSLRHVETLTPQLFKPGETLSITVRNQPRGQVKIVSVQQNRLQHVIGLPSGKPLVMDSPVYPDAYNYRVTLQDHALFTADGYVTSGVKIKTGLHINVEGHDYRIAGHIIDVHPVAETR
ncbi:MAG: DUF4330 domain-containing protein [Cyanobacteria bacterium P01_H01_bin.74]